MFCSIQAFFISNNFISTARLKLAINQANAKQRPETKLLLFENYSHSSTRYHPNKGHILNRSSRQRCSVKEGVLRNFAKFTGKHLCQSLFFNKDAGLRPATLLKRDSGARVFLWVLRNFYEHLLYRTPLDDCFCLKNKQKKKYVCIRGIISLIVMKMKMKWKKFSSIGHKESYVYTWTQIQQI